MCPSPWGRQRYKTCGPLCWSYNQNKPRKSLLRNAVGQRENGSEQLERWPKNTDFTNLSSLLQGGGANQISASMKLLCPDHYTTENWPESLGSEQAMVSTCWMGTTMWISMSVGGWNFISRPGWSPLWWADRASSLGLHKAFLPPCNPGATGELGGGGGGWCTGVLSRLHLAPLFPALSGARQCLPGSSRTKNS